MRNPTALALAVAMPLALALAGPAVAQTAPVTECDLLAAHGGDATRVSEGVDMAGVDSEAAVAACEAALAAYPGTPRLSYQLGRALTFAGRHEAALPHLRAAADAGHAVAASLLATYHLRGWGLEPDPETALSWRQRSAELGYPSAMRILCYRYAEGDGVAPDMDTAIGWCERAAAQDELIAFSMLAGFYREGRGVPRDVQEAARLFRRGAEVARAQAEAMPGDEYALNMQGWYVYEANRLDMDAASIAPALAALDRALALEPHMLNYPGTDADTILAGFLDTRAHLRDQAGDAAGALADYRAAMDLGGTEQISAYQTGLTDAGHFDGETDGTLTPALIAALEACIAAPDCDPLPQ